MQLISQTRWLTSVLQQNSSLTAVLKSLGIDPASLSGQTRESEYPTPVKGRVANIDADFIAYQVACETRDELDGIKPRRTLEDMKKQVKSIALHHQRTVGATEYVLFITPPGSTKGGRADYAVTKPYQGNRAEKTPPEHLDTIRAYMGEELPSVVSLDQEADDALAQANYLAIQAGTPELSVLVSQDKDLNMVPGYYYDFINKEVSSLDNSFGWIELYRPDKKPGAKTKPAAKIIGRGTKYFWAQTLMGDTADNIAGLPSTFEDNKVKKVGTVAAFNYLADCTSDLECYDVVRKLYRQSKHEWVAWDTQQPVTWAQALYGDMHLLWMRRSPEDRVDAFLLEVLSEDVPWIE